MKLQGKLAGPWVQECRKAWGELSSALGCKTLSLDLRGLSFVDASGVDLLHEIYDQTNAPMVTDSPLIKYFAEQAMRQRKTNGTKGHEAHGNAAKGNAAKGA